MSEAFIYYEFYEIGAKIKKSMERIDEELDTLLMSLDLLINNAKKDNVDPQQIDNMITVYYAIQRVKNYVDENLCVYSKLVMDAMRNELLKLMNSKICTYSDLDELVKRVGKDRAIIECYKQNIVVCRDATSMFIDLEKDEKMIDVVYFIPNGEPARMYIRYSPGRERIRGAYYPIVPAVYVKCLGVKVEAEAENK
ncbi:MAG: hypothetical protein LM583_10255 [Desulfurococcaceae archaeon]|nr:hypothetical protein [Desulfurococcaceae archaeon]